MKELETKMKKEWKKRGTEQSNRERKQRQKRGDEGDAHGRKVEDALQDFTNSLKMKMKTELFVQFAV